MRNALKDLKELQKYVDSMQQKTVLVIGDIMLDRFVYGAVNRISPESDAPVLDVRRKAVMPGGAGNVLANLQALGVNASLLGVIGDDTAGKDLAAALGNAAQLVVSATRPTTVKTRFINAAGQLLRADEESRAEISAQEQEKLSQYAAALVPQSDIVILSDYNKGVLTPALIGRIIALAREAGIPVLVDPKKSDYTVYKGASIVTPNRKELAEVSGLPAGSDEQIAVAAAQVMEQGGFTQLVVTRSEDGMAVFEQGQDPLYLPAEARSAADVSGAGDTVIAALAAGLAAGASLPEAAQLAGRAAALAVAKSGTASVPNEELQGALGEIPAPQALGGTGRDAPVCGWEQAAALIADWRKQGLQVGFTNGCFDILHFGHVSYLGRTRDHCDRLVVGLNHDASVKILKGPERPLHDEQSRAAVIGALASVDMVVLFGAEEEGEDNTPCALIEAIKPDIYFKGGDYTLDQLPEAAVMDKIGGRVEIMPLYEGHSTTGTIAKMKKTEAA